MVTRRQVLKGTAATGAVAATGGTAWWGLSGANFIPGTVEEEIEGQAEGFRSNIESIDEELDQAIEELSVPTDSDSYEGRGVQLTDRFNVAVPEDSQSFHIPREVDGDAVLYTWQEGTAPVGLDETWDKVRSEIGLGSEDEGVIEDVKDELGNAVLYTATTADGQPDFDDDDIAELNSVHDELSGEFDEVVQYLDELGYELTNVRALETDLRTSEYEKSHKLPLVGEVWGESYDESQITESEVEALRNGEDPYEEIGLKDSLDIAQEEYRSAARQAAKVGLVKELVGQTVADAEGQLEQYGTSDGEPEEPVEGDWDQYTVTDSELENYQQETDGFDQFAENIEDGSATQNTIYRDEGSIKYDNGDVVTTVPEEFADSLKQFLN